MCRTGVVGSMAGRQTSSDSVGCSACGELGVSWHAAIHTAAEAGPDGHDGQDGQDGNRVSATTAGEQLVHRGDAARAWIPGCLCPPTWFEPGRCLCGWQ